MPEREPAAAEPSVLDPEDAKLVALARAARARTGAAEGAALRDDTGRSYAAVTVDLPSLRLSALQAAVSAAVSSGADALEAGAVVTAAGGVTGAAGADVAVLQELGTPHLVVAAPDGDVIEVRRLR